MLLFSVPVFSKRNENEFHFTGMFLSFSWGILSHVTRLDQSLANKNIWRIIIFSCFGFGRYLPCNASQSPRLRMGKDQSTRMWKQRMLLWLKHLRRYLVFLWKHLRLASSFDQVTTQDHQGHEEKSTRTASSLEQWQNITVCQPTHDSLNQRPLSHRPYAHILTFSKQFYLFLFLSFFCKSTMHNTVLLCTIYTAVSTKVVPRKCKSVRDNADWHYG